MYILLYCGNISETYPINISVMYLRLIIPSYLKRNRSVLLQLIHLSTKPFINKRDELSIYKGCLLWGQRVVVPQSCRNEVLKVLHATPPECPK